MGADNQNDNPRRSVSLNYSFKMSLYPVTYRQFQTFSNSGEYDRLEWWRNFPEEYQPQLLDEQNNEYDNHPRDTVSWYQAVAFTRWLTARYRAAGLLPAEQEIRLPTEEEWEYAARGTDERRYPYGDEFDATRCNTDETGIGMTSAVGCFPDGASPFKVIDLSGNVWEWCLNKYHNPAEFKADNSTNVRLLRGGSFDYGSYGAACAYRLYARPDVDGTGVGFRVVLSEVSPNAPLHTESSAL